MANPHPEFTMVRSSIQAIPLFKGLRVATTGVTGSAGVYSYIDLAVPGFSEVLMYAESLTLVSCQRGGPASNEFEWNVEFIPGFDRENENAAIAIASADIAADGAARAAAYSTVTNFTSSARLRIRLKNKDTVSGVRTALISAILLVKVTS